jgi:hypothetical protein
MKHNCKTILKVQNSEETKIFIIYHRLQIRFLQFKRRRCNEPVYIFKVPLNYSALKHDDVPSIWFCFDLYQLSIKSEQTVDWRYHFEKNKTLTL